MARSDKSALPVGLISLVVLLLLWTVSASLAQSRALPNPLQVANAIVTELRSGELLFHMGATLVRVLAAFIVAMVIGSAIGILLGRSATLNNLFDPWVILFLNIPALVIIVLSYIWFGLNCKISGTAVCRDGTGIPFFKVEDATPCRAATTSALFRGGYQIGNFIDLENCTGG